jgi:spermidine synthase
MLMVHNPLFQLPEMPTLQASPSRTHFNPATMAPWRDAPRSLFARLPRAIPVLAGAILIGSVALAMSRADGLFDESVRAEMMKHRDGQVAHVETEYNDLFISKNGPYLVMSTRYKAESNIHSIVNLKDADDLRAPYTRLMSAGLLYPETTSRILMIGLGAGSISTYLARAIPDVRIDVIELDPGVIHAAREYFGLQETDRVRIIESDGRVYLNRHKERYDLILLDAYRELGVPFHLLTKEFYALVKEHLASGGAMAANIAAGTKLYASTLLTMRAVFPAVEVYPDYEEATEAQAIIVAAPMPAPGTETLMRRAETLQARYRFRYPLPGFVKKRITNHSAEDGELLTDDFSPVNLYETTPLRARRR